MTSLPLLVHFLEQRLREPLPGDAAHRILRARPSGKEIPTFTHKLPPKPGSVLILFYEENDRIQFPLIKRPEYLGAHSGQVSLPGGKAEPGESEVETALREGFEEVGIEAKQIEVVGTLSKFFVIPSNFMVTPVIGFVKDSPEFQPDEHEVDRILRANLDELLQPNAIQEKEIIAAGRFAMLAPHFEVENEIVWGATAMILNELRTILLEAPTR
jgi:8-oxo-dGTP pyrophosphatase MutT (NUDIX family)